MKMYYIIGIIIFLMLLIGARNSTNENIENSEAPNVTNESQKQNKLVESIEKEEATKKYSKKEYKKMCTEIVYNDIDKKIIGQYVTKVRLRNKIVKCYQKNFSILDLRQ